MSSLKRLIHEVHRRSLWQVLAVYVISAWIGYEVVQALTEGLGLPAWLPGLAVVLFVIGLPIVLGTAFVQEGGPELGRRDPTLLPGAAPDVETRAAPTAPEGVRRLFTWRNALMGGVAAFALWGVVAAAWLVIEGRGGRAGAAGPGAVSPTAVAVLPFAFRGDQEFAYLSEGFVDLLSTALDGAGDLRSVDPHALLASVERGGGARLDPTAAREIASRFGAGLFVLGSILEAGGRLKAEASLYDADGRHRAVAEATAEEESRVFELVDRLAGQLATAGAGSGSATRLNRIAASTTDSLTALKAYLAGEREFRAGQYGAAIEAFQRAVAADTAFALAYYRLSVAAEWIGAGAVVAEAAERAVRNVDRLLDRDRRLLEASLALRRGAGAEAARRYRAILNRYPEDLEAWYQLGEALFHYAPLMGRSVVESRQAFERVLALDPDHVFSLFHLARIEAFERNHAGLDSTVERVRALQPESERVLELVALRAFATDDTVAQRTVESALAGVDGGIVWTALVVVAGFAGDLEGATRLARLLTDSNRAAGERMTGYYYLAHLELARGRWTAAREAVSALGSLDRTVALATRAFLATAPYLARPSAELAELRAELESWDPVGPAGASGSNLKFEADFYHRPILPELRAYLLGLVSLRLGDDAAVRGYAAELGRASAGQPAMIARHLAGNLRAERAGLEDRPAEGLAALESAPLDVWYGATAGSPIAAQARPRFIRAELHAALGELDEAVRWFGSLTGYMNDQIYVAPSHLRRAEIYERLGDRDSARRHYARFIELWRDCDPELRPMVDRAEARLRALTAE